MTDRFQVFVGKEDFRFNAAHFSVYSGFRERLHGHNYRVSVLLEGEIGPDGYVVDFGDIKKATRSLCARLNERFIVPTLNDRIEVSCADGQMELLCLDDGGRYSMPEDDCAMLPIAHSSAEELALWFCDRLVEELALPADRTLLSLEVTVAEAPGQEARCCRQLPGKAGA